MAEAAAAQTAPPLARCQYFLPQKKRSCRLFPSPGQIYCGNHLYFATSDGERRVPCKSR